MKKDAVLAIIVPCYNEQEILAQTVKTLSELVDSLINKQLISSQSKIVFVNDGSKDNTWNIIQAAHKQNPTIKGISLSRNFGHQEALLAGLYNTDADCAFLLEYRRDEETLTLIGAAEDEDNDIEAVFPEETAPEKEVTVCSHCVRGHCKTCRGRGVVKCPECLGLGRCRACHGSGGIQTIGWGGVGTSAFIPCAECGGNGRCPGCDGKGRVECTECEHGVCKYCQGNYVISP